MQNWKIGCVFGHSGKLWKGHDGQIKENACKNTYLGFIFILGKYMFRVCFESPFTKMISSLKYKCPHLGVQDQQIRLKHLVQSHHIISHTQPSRAVSELRNKRGCPMDDQVVISSCPSKFLVVCKLPNLKQLLVTNTWGDQ